MLTGTNIDEHQQRLEVALDRLQPVCLGDPRSSTARKNFVRLFGQMNIASLANPPPQLTDLIFEAGDSILLHLHRIANGD